MLSHSIIIKIRKIYQNTVHYKTGYSHSTVHLFVGDFKSRMLSFLQTQVEGEPDNWAMFLRDPKFNLFTV